MRTQPQATPAHVVHPIEPLFDNESHVLILGSMPSPTSRDAGFYYAHPQNRFWRVLARLFEEEHPASRTERAAFVLRHGIALWDVLASCDIAGASDASIRNPEPNDLGLILDRAPITCVFTTGGTASHLYQRFDAPLWPELPHIALPSTSAANARASLDDLVAAYVPVLEVLRERS